MSNDWLQPCIWDSLCDFHGEGAAALHGTYFGNLKEWVATMQVDDLTEFQGCAAIINGST